jgi:hypothetical protein
MESFGGETPYSIMFGPDICGFSTRKVHVIFTKDGVNHLIKKDIKAESDQLTHVYTLVVKPDNTYKVCRKKERVCVCMHVCAHVCVCVCVFVRACKRANVCMFCVTVYACSCKSELKN